MTRLAAGALPPEEERPLLGARVHLALLFADDSRARATAEHIRALQSTPEARACAGATTFARIAARRAGGIVDGQRFAAEFARRLAVMPRGLPRGGPAKAGVFTGGARK